MPEKKTVEKAKRAKRKGKSPSTQAGEFVHEEMRHIRKGKHGARSTKQAIAIGLSQARRAGVKVKPPAKGKTLSKTRKTASKTGHKPVSKTRSAASKKALKKESTAAASHASLSRQGRAAAKKRRSRTTSKKK